MKKNMASALPTTNALAVETDAALSVALWPVVVLALMEMHVRRETVSSTRLLLLLLLTKRVSSGEMRYSSGLAVEALRPPCEVLVLVYLVGH